MKCWFFWFFSFIIIFFKFYSCYNKEKYFYVNYVDEIYWVEYLLISIMEEYWNEENYSWNKEIWDVE